ncbi:hypothetical protein [Nonomuraea sp. NPDC049309]|uniref:hypothetical protein n=1 Tax=Nonomuraea sp. NPDC049309 TaxID=3364350 RepID=UPI003718332D
MAFWEGDGNVLDALEPGAKVSVHPEGGLRDACVAAFTDPGRGDRHRLTRDRFAGPGGAMCALGPGGVPALIAGCRQGRA